MTEAPYVRAAFINNLAEEGTKTEVIEYLQKYWNENWALRAEVKQWKEQYDLLLRRHTAAGNTTLAYFTEAELRNELHRRVPSEGFDVRSEFKMSTKEIEVTVDGVVVPMPIDGADEPMFVADGAPNPDFDWAWWKNERRT